MNSTVPLYCGKGLDNFHTWYMPIHGYLSLFVCILGSVANILNIVVLTRREMRSPTNAILTGLAIADLLVMFDYIPYAWLDYILRHNLHYSREILLSYSSAWYIMFHSIFAQICHTISVWLTVTLAVWRYIAVGYPQKNRLWCGMQTTLITIASAYIVCPMVAIPLYLAQSIKPSVEVLDTGGQLLKNSTTFFTGHNVTVYKVAYKEIVSMPSFSLWMYSVLLKLIPCVALTILSMRLIGALLETKRRRKQLINSNGMKKLVNGKVVETSRKSNKMLDKEKQTDRTTRMLLAVLLLFLITEFPQGVLGLFCIVLGNPFLTQCYVKLGEVMDILALINSGINFILYCSMSRQFRKTFTLLFRPKCLDRWSPLAHDDDNAMGRTDGGRDDVNGHTTQVTQV